MKHQYLRQFTHILYAAACFAVFFLIPGAKAQAQNTVAFTADNWSGCGAVFVQFLNQSSPVGTASWDFGDGGAKSTLWNPTRSFNKTGSYNVVLTVTFPNGQVLSTQHTVNVYGKPVVQFSTTPVTGCTPLPVTFTDQSDPGSGSIASISWDFGDGNGGTGLSTTHTYDRGGTTVATSIVTNSFGCTGSGAQVLQISPTPEVSFTSNTQGGCRTPVTINFTNTTTLNTGGTPPTVNYLWNFGDGTTDNTMHPTHAYTTTGNFNVTLTATTTDGCTRTFTAPSFIKVATTTASYTLQGSPCAGPNLTFKNTTLPTPVSARWTFSDGTVLTTIDAVRSFTPGNYSVELRTITSDGCEAIVNRNFTISAIPTISFTMNPTGACSIPVNVQFTTGGTGATAWAWTFGDGTTGNIQNPLHNYTKEGTFPVKVVASNAAGCKDSVTNPITIKKPTLAITGPNRGCIPFTTTLGTTITSSDPVVSYAWNLGDGTTSALPNPTHTYTTQARFPVTLTITTASGCTQTATYDVRAGRPLTVDFSVDKTNGCQPTVFNFTDIVTPPTGALTYQWTFEENSGANGTSTVKNPAYVFSSIGWHDVTFAVINNGCTSRITKPNFIETIAPIANFTVNATDCTNPMTRSFTDATDWGGPAAPIGTYTWDFGDGTTDNTQSPTHTYTTEGTYTVTLTVSNGTCNSTYSTTVRLIAQKPVIHVDANTVCLGAAVTFTVDPLTPGTVGSYRWNFGDGRSNTGSVKPVLTYRNAGSYTTTFTVTDILGCQHVSDPITVEVNGSIPKFTVSPQQCKDKPVTFSDQSTTRAGNTIVSWTFDFGDGTAPVVYTAQPINITHTYTTINDYTVTMTVRDNTGCDHSASQVVKVANVVATFTSRGNIACLNTPFQFENLSVTEPLTYAWTFGDGGTSVDKNPAHIYTAPGKYTVALDVSNAAGCTDRMEVTDYLRVPNPVADFTFPPVAGDICPPVKVQFTNNSSDYEKLSWSFGDGGSSDEVNPIHNYIRPGTFPVTLTAYSEGGCASVVAGPKDVSIAGPDGTFSVSSEAGCAPLTTSMSANAPNAQRFIWDFGDGYSVRTTTPNSPTYTYTKEGVYYPVVLLEDQRGCTVPATGTPKVVVDKITPFFGVNLTQSCDGGVVYFTDSTKGISIDDGNAATYLWDFGVPGRTDDIGTGPNPSWLYDAPGTYLVKMTATSYYGCVKDTTVQIVIEATPTAQIDPVAPFCLGGTVQLVGRDTRNIPGAKWQWTTNGQTYPVQVPAPIKYPQPGIYPVQLTITTASGVCSSTATENIEVAAYPTLAPTPTEASICLGQSLTLQANTEAGVDITWTNYNISDPKSASPVITPDMDTTYRVTVVNGTGCTTNGSVKVLVSQPFTVQASDADICVGGAVQLHAEGAVTYEWTPSTGLSKTDIPNPMATPAQTTTYQVTGYGRDNCFTDTKEVTVGVHPMPTVNAGEDMEVPVGTAVNLPVTGSNDITKIEWWPAGSLDCADCLTPVATPRENTTYHVKVTNAYGCTVVDDVTIKLVCSSSVVFLPNTFTPNNDGQNDLFYVRGKGIKLAKSFKIYNRWGQLVFERTNFNIENPAFGWDGRVNGVPANPDVFVYVAELVCDSNEDFTLKGNVMLVR